MKNIINYLENSFHSMDEKPFNIVDSLILSQISYVNFGNLIGGLNLTYRNVKFVDLLKAEHFNKMFHNIRSPKLNRDLLFALAASPRFRNIEINYHITKIDEICEKQFSATTFILDYTSAYIAFRGTDYSITGWKEDFNMAFTTPIPSQEEGILYVNEIAKRIPHKLYLGGHSKGGNIAVYSAMNCNPKHSDRIISIFSHDGPGFTHDIITSDKFNLIKSKINKILPQSSLIGMLLESHEDYKVVRSHNIGGLLQHDPFSWEILNDDFSYLDCLSTRSTYTNTGLNNWINTLNNEKRKLFIDTLFDVIKTTKCKNFIDLLENWKVNLPVIINALKNIDHEVKDLIIEFIKELAVLHFKSFASNDKFDIFAFKEALTSNFYKNN